MKKLLFIPNTLLLLIFVGCAHSISVKEGKNNQLSISKTGSSAGQAYDRAYKQALHYCDKSDKRVKILKKEQKYTGKMSEAEYRKQHDYSQNAMIAGGALSVLGRNSRSVNSAGNLLFGGGLIVNAATKDAYYTKLKFTCI